MRALVETAWLEGALSSVTLLDGSWYLKKHDRDPRAEFAAGHIPGARFFDIETISDPSASLPHMLPDSERFAREVSLLGVDNRDHVVVYDGAGLFSAARVWWMFRVFGHENVSVLDGGLPKWIAEGRPVTRPFSATLQPELVRVRSQMLQNLTTQTEQVLDARGADRFFGRTPEPRPGVRGGHIPQSRNVPYAELLNEDGTMKSEEALRSILDGLDLNRPIATTCGSGVTACIIALALHRLGRTDVAVYDGSWAEWGGRDDTPVEQS